MNDVPRPSNSRTMDPSASAHLHRLAQRARAGWPEIHVPEEAFLAFLRERLPAKGTTAEIHAADVYLACACVRGDPQARKEVVERCLAQVPSWLGAPEDRGHEIRGLLEERLFGDPPRIAEYSGRGSLEAWIRVAAVHLSLELFGEGEDPAPLLAFVPDGWRASVAEAFRTAFASLTAGERTLLRLHFVERLGLGELALIYGEAPAALGPSLAMAQEPLLERTLAALPVQARDELNPLLRSRWRETVAALLR
jgi:RNA polymerase sigma-70 factor (ECF subfamily)